MNSDAHFSKHVTLSAKGIAIWLMLFHHLFYDAPAFTDRYAVSSFPLSWPLLNSLSYYAKLCVSIFVFLTGYGMAVRLSGMDRKQRETYTLSRFLKLESSVVFIYLFSILTALFQPSRIGMYFEKGRLKGFLLMIIDGLGLAQLFDSPKFNNSWWYISFAIFLIFLMPVALKLYEHFGVCTVMLAAMITTFGLDASRAFTLYLFSLFLGIYTARSRLITDIRNYCSSGLRTLCCLFLFLALFVVFSCIRIRWGFYLWTNGLASMFLVLALFTLIDLMKIRLRLLEIYGRYSIIIYMTHTLIYHHYFTEFIYAPKNWFFILLLLGAVSLALALVLTLIRRLVKWDSIPLWHLANPQRQ